MFRSSWLFAAEISFAYDFFYKSESVGIDKLVT